MGETEARGSLACGRSVDKDQYPPMRSCPMRSRRFRSVPMILLKSKQEFKLTLCYTLPPVYFFPFLLPLKAMSLSWNIKDDLLMQESNMSQFSYLDYPFSAHFHTSVTKIVVLPCSNYRVYFLQSLLIKSFSLVECTLIDTGLPSIILLFSLTCKHFLKTS